jgi:hypothetical protein
MHFRTFALVAAASLMLAIPTPALASDCEPCAGKTCSIIAKHDGDATAASVLLPEKPAPARQAATVWFMRPVLVGSYILQGQYIIEHDTDRQARGEPCTHIYAMNNRRLPVVMFHCTHLEGEAAERDVVTIVSTGDPSGLTKLKAFQFAGDTAAHGVPAAR